MNAYICDVVYVIYHIVRHTVKQFNLFHTKQNNGNLTNISMTLLIGLKVYYKNNKDCIMSVNVLIHLILKMINI